LVLLILFYSDMFIYEVCSSSTIVTDDCDDCV